MALRLDPQLPVVWRTPTSVQFGVTRPAVVLENLDLAAEKMIAALGSGVSRSGLGMIGRSAGASDAAIDQLLDRLKPAMLAERAIEPHTVVVTGVSRFASRLVTLLADAGVTVLVAHSVTAAELAECELAVVVAHFVVEPELLGTWLRRDVPHLPVVLGDSSAAIGPFVEPGRSACLYCLQLHARDADAAWPAIASQLWGRRSPADTELLASEGAAIAARDVLARLAGGVGVRSTQLAIDAQSGAQSQRSFEVHPQCGCVEPGFANAEVLRESDSPRESVRRPTTGTTAFARE